MQLCWDEVTVIQSSTRWWSSPHTCSSSTPNRASRFVSQKSPMGAKILQTTEKSQGWLRFRRFWDQLNRNRTINFWKKSNERTLFFIVVAVVIVGGRFRGDTNRIPPLRAEKQHLLSLTYSAYTWHDWCSGAQMFQLCLSLPSNANLKFPKRNLWFPDFLVGCSSVPKTA